MEKETIEKIIKVIWNDINGRSGMDWGQYDSEIQQEIKNSWRAKLANII